MIESIAKTLYIVISEEGKRGRDSFVPSVILLEFLAAILTGL